MKNYRSNLAFIDLLFNLLVGFVSLFVLAFLLINPVAKTGKIDPDIELMISMEWDDERRTDIDLWVKGPTGNTVYFGKKNNGYLHLDRDDLGTSNDSVLVNGVHQIIKRNKEVANIRGIIPGEYVVNVHWYGKYGQEGPEPVKIELYDMKPFKIVLVKEVILPEHKSERTAFSFVVDKEGNVSDIRTDINIKLTRSNIVAHGMTDDE